MDKTELRTSIVSDIETFLANGGMILHSKPARKRKPKMTVTGKQKGAFRWSQPKNRPSNSFDGIASVDE